jgi:hypothetical protein
MPLRGKDILVNDTAETIPAQNAISGRRRCNRATLGWRERQRSMWPVPVVMIHKYGDGPLDVLPVQNQPPVETF